MVHVQVRQDDVGHRTEIDVRGLQSLGQLAGPLEVRELPSNPSVEEDGPAAAAHHDRVQRPLEHVRRQKHVLHPVRPAGRIDVVAQHRAWQR